MKKIFLLSFLLSIISPVYANSFCKLVSEKEPDVSIAMNYPSNGYGYGTMNYKNKPAYFFEVGISNGYGTQYYQLKKYSSDVVTYDPKLKSSFITKNTELISNGRFVNFVGNQLGRSTSKKDRKSGELKALMPTLPQDYYYSLTNNHKKGEYGRFNLSPKMKAILTASEGFFVDSGGCRKYFAYGWY